MGASTFVAMDVAEDPGSVNKKAPGCAHRGALANEKVR
jgi:hypothetical protein